MNLYFIYNRTKDIIINPQIEWTKIKSGLNEQKSSKITVLIPYSLFYAFGSILGNLLFNQNNMGFGFNFFYIVFIAINSFFLFYLGTSIASLLINELQHNFGIEKNINIANTLIVNTLIPYFLFTTISAIFPQFAVLLLVLGFYSIYLFWFGISTLLTIQAEKKIAFFILSAMIIMVIFFLLRFILGSIFLYISDFIMS